MFDHQTEYVGEPADEAERLDRAQGDIDWTVLPEGAVTSRFAAPSGSLAVVSLGDPTHPRVLLAPGRLGVEGGLHARVAGARRRRLLRAELRHRGAVRVGGRRPRRPKRGKQEKYDYALFRDDMVALLESGGPAHVLGYSFAGTVAQLVTVERPELVRSLTLLAAPPEPGNGFRGVRGLGPFTWMVGGKVGAALMTWGIVTNKNHVPPQRLEFVRMRFD